MTQPTATDFYKFVRQAIHDKKAVKFGNVEFTIEGNDVVYDLPLAIWDKDSIVKDLTQALKDKATREIKTMTKMVKSKFYVGVQAGQKWQVFKSTDEPTRASHGELYRSVIGPFRTKRGAVYMADYGPGNPHCRNVSEAEHLARKYATETETRS